MSLVFYKYETHRNDFIFVDVRKDALDVDFRVLSEEICDRKRGVGSDMFIILNYSSVCDFRLRFFNLDGTEAGMKKKYNHGIIFCSSKNNILRIYILYNVELCGNAMRSACQFASIVLKCAKKIITFETGCKITQTIQTENLGDSYRVLFKQKGYLKKLKISIRSKNGNIVFNVVKTSMGNPHALIFFQNGDDFEKLNVGEIGPLIENHEAFAPSKTNVEFAQILSRNKIRLKVWERGCGITCSCASGAAAVVLVAFKERLVDNKVLVEMEGGSVMIEIYEKLGEYEISQSGPSNFVFSGNYPLKEAKEI